MSDVFTALRAQIGTSPVATPIGRISEIARGTLRVTGLETLARQGDRLRIGAMGGEVLQLSPTDLVALTDGPAEGLAIGTAVELVGPAEIAPDNAWIGRIIDPYGRPLDGRPLLRGAQSRSLHAEAPPAARRRRLGARLSTGVAVFDTLLPLVRGQRIGLFAGSGVGKSSLLAKFARGVAADIVVIALIGERGRELREFTEKVLGPAGMARSVIVAATSYPPPLTRG
jgi:flagellum-specific ATP synthase